MVWSKDLIRSVSESGTFSTTAVEVSQIARLGLIIASTYQRALGSYNRPIPVTLSLLLNESN